MNLTPVECQVITLMAGKADGVITHADLVTELFQIKGHQIMTVVTVTEPSKMRKTGNPYVGRVVKLAYSQVRVGADYENAVNNQREREGSEPTFEAKFSWHEPVASPTGGFSPFCRHKTTGDFYLRCIFDKHITKRYVDKVTGETIPDEVIEAFIPPSPAYEGQGLDKTVKFLTYKLSSIVGYNANGKSRIVTA